MASHDQIPSDGIDATLAANFAELMGSRSIATLRQEMAERGIAIGSAAIQAAKQGSRGIRLETLQKFADFFGCQVHQLLQSGDLASEGTWPFKKLTEAEFRRASSEMKEEAEAMLIRSARRASAPR
ncbi:helix-turn-helix domain-containing protein [Variovorax sp. DAIF25]|uniref:helix-turn-helix domain-containing protein n=1 Tax=Variovorax sp. DAIF25 TaxID=3080983 RepID=UPI003D6ACA2F